jgi:hypothetical protein
MGDMLSQTLYDKTVDVGKTYAVLIKDNFPLFTLYIGYCGKLS